MKGISDRCVRSANFFFASLDFLTVLQNVVTVEFRSLPFFARIFSCTHERRLNSGFVRHVAMVRKRTCGQSHGENHDAGKAKELEKEYREKIKKCFED